MIKIGLRHNLIYPIIFAISNFARNIEVILMQKFEINLDDLFIIIMFFSEFISGLILYLYNKKIFYKKGKVQNNTKIIGIELIHFQRAIIMNDNCVIIYIFIFLTASFDFIDFSLKTFFLPKLEKNSLYISETLYMRLNIVLTLFSAFFGYILLKIKIYRHQKCSLIILIFCLILVLFGEYFAISHHFNNLNDKDDKSLSDVLINFTYSLGLRIIGQLFFSFQDIMEKYLLEYDFINPFQLIMFEGIFGIILSLIIYTFKNPLKDIKEDIQEYNKDYNKFIFFILLITFAFIYFVLSGIKNLYRIVTNKVFNPTTKSLIDVIFHPILIIINYYINLPDKQKSQDKKSSFFIFNLSISFIMVISCSIYNELIVCNCCGLGFNTYLGISNRAYENEGIFIKDNNDDIITISNQEDSGVE